MDTAQWPEQGIGVVKSSMEEKKQAIRPQRPQAINCPRCNSTHTKFCYYNNYSLTQPRYFCKTCRRYWTEGGSLRNVPVGGGSRKNKRSSPANSSASSKINKLVIHPDHHHMGPPPITFPLDQNPNKINIHNIDHQGHDLNLAYPHPNISDHQFSAHDHHQLPFNQENKTYPSNNSSSTTISPQFSAMEFLKNATGIITSRGSSSSPFMSSFISLPMPMSMPVSDSNSNTIIYSSAGIPFQEFKPSLNFSLEGFGSSTSGYNIAGSSSCLQEAGVQETGTTTDNNSNTSARLFFPPDQELKPTTNEDILEQNRGEEDSNGYWINGSLGGGSW